MNFLNNNFPTTVFLSAGGLFDFDLTFFAEGLLFFILGLVVSFVFLSPISKQLNERAELINYTLRKSTILISLGYEKLSTCLELLIEEIDELNRQVKLTKKYTTEIFENEIIFVQEENTKILNQLKGELSLKSASLFSTLNKELILITNNFFNKKFSSIS